MTTKHAVKATKMALFEALRDLGWSYTIETIKDPSGPTRTRFVFKTDVIEQLKKNRRLVHKIPTYAEYLLPSVQIGDFNMTIMLDPTFPILSIVPFDKTTMIVEDNEVIVKMDDEIIAIFGRYGKPKTTQVEMEINDERNFS